MEHTVPQVLYGSFVTTYAFPHRGPTLREDLWKSRGLMCDCANGCQCRQVWRACIHELWGTVLREPLTASSMLRSYFLGFNGRYHTLLFTFQYLHTVQFPPHLLRFGNAVLASPRLS